MTKWTIDRICGLTRKPTVLNALHACRPDHPWNKTADRPWLSAWFVAKQQSYFERVPDEALDWLLAQSKAAGEQP